MHFSIIRIEPINLLPENWDITLDPADCILMAHTDYYGDIYSAEERQNVIHSDWLPSLLSGIATVDAEKETITFLDRNTVKDTIRTYLEKETERLFHMAKAGRLCPFDLRYAGHYFRDNWTLFYFEDSGRTSFQFVEDAKYHAGETFRIGNIFDAHI